MRSFCTRRNYFTNKVLVKCLSFTDHELWSDGSIIGIGKSKLAVFNLDIKQWSFLLERFKLCSYALHSMIIDQDRKFLNI